MCIFTQKADALDSGGFVFDYRYGTYVNVRKKIIFTHQLVDVLAPEELETRIVTAAPKEEWQFFCTKPPSQSVCDQIVAVYSGKVAYSR
jgi:hypothetical protein